MSDELPPADFFIAACNALEEAGRNHLLPEKAKRLAFHLRSALLVEREHRMLLTQVVLQLVPSDIYNFDSIDALREQVQRWESETPRDIGMEK
jgi:hypothetical protein